MNSFTCKTVDCLPFTNFFQVVPPVAAKVNSLLYQCNSQNEIKHYLLELASVIKDMMTMCDDVGASVGEHAFNFVITCLTRYILSIVFIVTFLSFINFNRQNET